MSLAPVARKVHCDRVSPEPERPHLDVVLPHAPADGGGVQVVRIKECENDVHVELGEVHALVEGRPIAPSAEVVRLKPRVDGRGLDVEVLLPRRAQDASAASTHKGPGQIASDAYRTNWDAIFTARERGRNRLS